MPDAVPHPITESVHYETGPGLLKQVLIREYTKLRIYMEGKYQILPGTGTILDPVLDCFYKISIPNTIKS